MSETVVGDTDSVVPRILSNKKEPCRRPKCIAIGTVTSLLTNFALVVVLVHYHTKPHSNQITVTPVALRGKGEWLKNSVCVNCRMFGISPDQTLFSQSGVWRLSVQDGQMCCLSQAESLRRLLSLFILKSMLKTPRETLHTLPSAHLYLDTLDDNNYKWSAEEYGHSAGHVIKPIHLENGRLYTEKAGFYNIYSFITFKRRTGASKPKTIKHSIKRIVNARKPHTNLLQTSIELPGRSETFASSYLSGIVQLQANDELYVDVSDVGAVYRFAPCNFFGVLFVKSL